MPALRRARAPKSETLQLSSKALLERDWQALNSLVWNHPRPRQYAEFVSSKRHSKRAVKK